MVLVICLTFSCCGCFGGFDSDNDAETEVEQSVDKEDAELKETLIELRDSTYKLFKIIYDETTGSHYYSDVGYNVDLIENRIYGVNKNFGIEETWPTGSMYYVKWIAYIKVGYIKYKLAYLEMWFNQNFRVSRKGIGQYDIN